MVPKICSGQKTMDGGRQTADGTRRTDIWITKSLPELSSGETIIIPLSKLDANIKGAVHPG